MGNLRCIILFSVCMFVYQTLADEEISSDYVRRGKRQAASPATSIGELKIVTTPVEPYLFIDKMPAVALSLHMSVAKHIMSLHPFKQAVENVDGTVDIYTGFIPDLIYLLSKRLHFSYSFYLSPDGRYGTKQLDNTWNGMIGELLKNEADNKTGAHIAAAPITVTADREDVVDFVTAFQNLGLSVLVKKPWGEKDEPSKSFSINFSIFTPIGADLWAFVIISFLLCGLLLWLMNMYNPYEWGGRYSRGMATEEEGNTFTLTGSIWFTFTSLQWQGFDRTPRSLGGKLLTLAWFAFVSLFLIAYTGSVLNHLFWASAVQSKNLREVPIDGLDDLVKRNYTFGCIKNSSTYFYLTDVAVGEEFEIIRKYLLSEDGKKALVDNVQDGLKRVREENYALIGETMILKHEANRAPCDVMLVGEQFALKSYGLALPKNSPFLEQMHRAVLELIQEGEIETLERKWWTDRGECFGHRIVDRALQEVLTIAAVEPQRISLSLFWQPVLILVLGSIFAAILSVVEIIYFKYRGRYSSSNRPRSEPLEDDTMS